MADKSFRFRVHFRARALAAEQGCLTIHELHSRIVDMGLSLSESQLGKLLRSTPRQLNLDLLAALCATFEVAPNDLLVLQKVGAPKVAEPQGAKAPKATKAPRVGALPADKGSPPEVTPLPKKRASYG